MVINSVIQTGAQFFDIWGTKKSSLHFARLFHETRYQNYASRTEPEEVDSDGKIKVGI